MVFKRFVRNVLESNTVEGEGKGDGQGLEMFKRFQKPNIYVKYPEF